MKYFKLFCILNYVIIIFNNYYLFSKLYFNNSGIYLMSFDN